MTADLYDELGVTGDATADDIKAAYRAQAKKLHPDAGGDSEKFGALQKAYDVLSDPERRQRYDETGATETSDPEYRVDAQARQLFADMLVQIIDLEAVSFDPLQELRVKARQAIAIAKAEIANIKSKKKRTERLAKKFKAKGKRDLPGDILKHMAGRFDQAMNAQNERIDVMNKLLAIVDEYEFTPDPKPPADPYAVYGRSMFSGTAGI